MVIIVGIVFTNVIPRTQAAQQQWSGLDFSGWRRSTTIGTTDGLMLDQASSDSFVTSGYASITFQPSPGQLMDWQAVTFSTTAASGQTAELSFKPSSCSIYQDEDHTPNADINFQTDITSVVDSETLCLRIYLTSMDYFSSPTAHSLTLTYAPVGIAPTPTPCPPNTQSSCGTPTVDTCPSTVALLIDADTHIQAEAPTTNFGDSSIYLTNEDANGDPAIYTKYGLFRFPAAQVPSSAARIYLNLPVYETYEVADRNEFIMLQINRLVTDAFNESTVVWNDLGSAEIHEDTNYTYAKATTFSRESLSNTVPTAIQFDVTQYVKDVQSGSITNTGFLVSGTSVNNTSIFLLRVDHREGASQPAYITWTGSCDTLPNGDPTPEPTPTPTTTSSFITSPTPTPTPTTTSSFITSPTPTPTPTTTSSFLTEPTPTPTPTLSLISEPSPTPEYDPGMGASAP